MGLMTLLKKVMRALFKADYNAFTEAQCLKHSIDRRKAEQEAIRKLKRNQHHFNVVTDNFFKPAYTQEDSKTTQALKRLDAHFKAEMKNINMRALKRHAADCPDPLTCTRETCWSFEPDKIVSEPYTIVNTRPSNMLDLNER